MEAWQQNEINCCNYLNGKYGHLGYNFSNTGFSNSYDSDILVSKDGQNLFYIEAKMPAAQCGQFVLLESNNQLIFSPRNQSMLTPVTQSIINSMNSFYSYYSNPGTAGKDLNMDKRFFYQWILEHYMSKNTRFFIVGTSTGFIIFPIEKFVEYFDISAKYRVKKSGSTSPSANNFQEICAVLQQNGISYSNLSMNYNGVTIQLPGQNGKFKLQGLSYGYQFNPLGNAQFEIRRLSNTRNANVIFSISLLKQQDPSDLVVFESVLK